MSFDRAHIQRMNGKIAPAHLRQMLTVLIVLALLFVVATLVIFVTRAQNPNCGDLKKRLDDATRAYQTVLTQSQTIDRNFYSYESAVGKLRSDLIANDKKREQAEKRLFDAERDRRRCERDAEVLPTGGCANVSQRIATAERNIAYARANQKKLEAELAEKQQKLAGAKAMLKAASASLTNAQQELDEANKAFMAAGCATENAIK